MKGEKKNKKSKKGKIEKQGFSDKNSTLNIEANNSLKKTLLKLKKILEPTYGVIIYQEQVMQIAQTLSGFSAGEADILRRAMGKKKKAELGDEFRVPLNLSPGQPHPTTTGNSTSPPLSFHSTCETLARHLHTTCSFPTV